MPKPLVVIDTNVIVSGLRSRNGWSFSLLSQIGTGAFEHCVSVALVLEYEDVLKRSATILGLELAAIDTLMHFWCDSGRKTLIYFQIEAALPDAGDIKVMELAVAAQADFVITFNKRHFPDTDRFGIRVVTPLEFFAEMGMSP